MWSRGRGHITCSCTRRRAFKTTNWIFLINWLIVKSRGYKALWYLTWYLLKLVPPFPNNVEILASCMEKGPFEHIIAERRWGKGQGKKFNTVEKWLVGVKVFCYNYLEVLERSDDKVNIKKQDIKALKMRKKKTPRNTQQLFFSPYVPCESEVGVT